MYFQEFCDKIANDGVTELPYIVPLSDEFREPAKVLVDIVRPKLYRLDTLKITFIQNKFDDMSEVFDTLEEVYKGEIDDSVVTYLSESLYSKLFNELNVKEQSIIKVLAVYLMLQSANKNN